MVSNYALTLRISDISHGYVEDSLIVTDHKSLYKLL